MKKLIISTILVSVLCMSFKRKHHTVREKEVMQIYNERHSKNLHKMEPIHIFDADESFIKQIGYRPMKEATLV